MQKTRFWNRAAVQYVSQTVCFQNVCFMLGDYTLTCVPSLEDGRRKALAKHTHTIDPNHGAAHFSLNPLSFVIFLSGIFRMAGQSKAGTTLHRSLRETLNLWKKLVLQGVVQQKVGL